MAHEYKDIFIEEAREQVDILNDRLLEIEKNPENDKYIHDIFRVAHTLKSSAAFVGLQELSDFCHKIESLFQKIRDKEILLTTDLVDLLFQSLDKIRQSIEAFAETDEILKEFDELTKQVIAFAAVEPPTDELDAQKKEGTVTTKTKSIELKDKEWALIEDCNNKEGQFFYISVFFEPDIKMKWVRAELLYVNMDRMGTIIVTNPLINEFKSEKLDEKLEAIISANTSPDDIKAILSIDLIRDIQVDILSIEDLKKLSSESSIKPDPDQKQIEKEAELQSNAIEPKEDLEPIDATDKKIVVDEPEKELKVEKAQHSQSSPEKNVEDEKIINETAKLTVEDVDSKNILSKSDTVRIPIKKLDELLNLVGELAITNSGFVEISERFQNLLGNQEIMSEFATKIDVLSGIARNLQEGIMQSRMVPIGTVFSRFNRLIRDLSRNLDKKVNIHFKGDETELDKKIIDVIGDPLIHLIRNSLDHGIESVSERLKAGKSEAGNITLNAYQSGNHIYVEVSDDGRGLNRERILEKAREQNIIEDKDIDNLPESEIYNFIFLPGFSTKKEVTAISGRGVGMDVVISTVKELNGFVNVKSKKGEGSIFTLFFPLTLAIVSAILTQCASETYAIPLNNVLETIKLDKKEVQTIDFQEVVRLRDQVIPIIRLNDLFDISSSLNGEILSIVISEVEGQQVGIVVDELIGKREIVIKALNQDFQEMTGVSGATILGNGKIALILDIQGLIDLSTRGGSSRRRVNIDRHRNNNSTVMAQQAKLMELKFEAKKKNINEILRKFNLDLEAFMLMKEIFKVALATSSNNVKNFLNKNVVLAIPDIEVHPLREVKEMGDFLSDEKMFFAELDFTEALHGKIILILDEFGMENLFRDLIGDEKLNSEVGESCIKEIVNLLGAGITNTLSRALQLRSYPSPPRFYYESYKSYFRHLFQEHQDANNEYIWIIDTNIILNDRIVKGKVYILPYDRSFKDIGKRVIEKKADFSFMKSE